MGNIAQRALNRQAHVPIGQIYSVNDARYFDWPEGLRRYIDTIRQGKGQHPMQYSARYVCSLVCPARHCPSTTAHTSPLHIWVAAHYYEL